MTNAAVVFTSPTSSGDLLSLPAGMALRHFSIHSRVYKRPRCFAVMPGGQTWLTSTSTGDGPDSPRVAAVFIPTSWCCKINK